MNERLSIPASFFAHPKHGPLPAILLLLTLGTGLVDAVSILGLGRVFVANMTGNVVFIGFSLAGAPGFSLWGSLVALLVFLIGAWSGGILIARLGTHRGRLLRTALLIELGLFLTALTVSVLTSGQGGQVVILGVAAWALGIQNAVVRNLAVPDMTTTVLTMTLTGIGSDLRHGNVGTASRRIIVVLSMLVGAGSGALLVTHLGVPAGMLAVVILAAVALVATALVSRGEPAWATPDGR